MVEDQGFEPWEALTLRWLSRPVQSTNSANPPLCSIICKTVEGLPRFELGIEALQASALPLGDSPR